MSLSVKQYRECSKYRQLLAVLYFEKYDGLQLYIISCKKNPGRMQKKESLKTFIINLELFISVLSSYNWLYYMAAKYVINIILCKKSNVLSILGPGNLCHYYFLFWMPSNLYSGKRKLLIVDRPNMFKFRGSCILKIYAWRLKTKRTKKDIFIVKLLKIYCNI